MNAQRSVALVACLVCLHGGLIQEVCAQNSDDKRPVTVADSIRMTRLANPNYIAGARAKPKVAEFSPDGKRFVIVVRKGNLENNTNEYSLLLFRRTDAFSASSPDVLLTLASSSNRPAIQQVSWLNDNDTIVFLGEGPGENQQVYRFACGTRHLERLTNHPTQVVTFSVAQNGSNFAFIAERAKRTVWTEEARRSGISVTTQRVADLITGNDVDRTELNEVFVMSSDGPPKLVEIGTPVVAGGGVRLSPDGRYVVVMGNARGTFDGWQEYEDTLLNRLLQFRLPSGAAERLLQYILVDTHGGHSAPLVDAPIDPLYGSELAWSPDSRSVIVTGTYLPLDTADPAERQARKRNTFVVEVKVPGREITKFPANDLRLVRWDVATGGLLFQAGRRDALLGKDARKVAYMWRGGTWTETGTTAESQVSVEVSLEEDLNSPPRIFAIEPASGKRTQLMDLNPQFSSLDITRVQRVWWKASDGHDVDGGLYLPPEYVPGMKYPLILQTHGFNPNRFWMDGPWTTSFAAQAFASRGFVVLQVNDWPNIEQGEWRKIFATLAEGPYQMAALEGAVDYLDGRGLIDRSRVGVIGFSRSCFYVKFALTHSRYKFAAASVADGVDAGYFQYIQHANSATTVQESEGLNGGLAFGETLSSWLKLSPGFNLHKVHTPIRIEALYPGSLLFEWEWFSGLSRLGKPVDLVFLPDGTHVLEKPWERFVSQQGNVDWFSFWLKDEEDPDPAKSEQYSRWRMLRQRLEKSAAAPE